MTFSRHSNRTKLLLPLLTAALAALLTGCSGFSRPLLDGDARLRVSSRQPGATGHRAGSAATGEFTQAFYRFGDQNTVTVMLIQGGSDELERIAVVDMFWNAKAGATPTDRTATNAVVRFFEFRDSDAEPNAVGLYAGAGFVRLHDDPKGGIIDGNLWDADLRLTDRSEAFTDRLGRAVLAGSFTAQRDNAKVTAILREINQQLEERLGYPRLVQAGLPPIHLLSWSY